MHVEEAKRGQSLGVAQGPAKVQSPFCLGSARYSPRFPFGSVCEAGGVPLPDPARAASVTVAGARFGRYNRHNIGIR